MRLLVDGFIDDTKNLGGVSLGNLTQETPE
jgi:hypothetical protein